MTLPQSAVSLLQPFPYDLSKQRILVLAPHCDDEILSSAGVIQSAIEKNSEVQVSIVTDCNKHKNGSIRKEESRQAVSEIGLKNKIIFLDIPEAEDALSLKNPKNQTAEEAIRQTIDDFNPSIILTPHIKDTHIDHKNTGIVTQKVVAGKDINVAYYLIHYNFLKYPSPSGLKIGGYLTPPIRLINHDTKWYTFSLTDEQEANKESAVLKYKSQLKISNPILHEILLDFIRKNEIFMIYDDGSN